MLFRTTSDLEYIPLLKQYDSFLIISFNLSSCTWCNLMNPNTTPMQIARSADTSLKMIDQFYYPQSQLKTDIKDFLRIK